MSARSEHSAWAMRCRRLIVLPMLFMARQAYADMGPAAVIPVIGLPLLQLAFGIALVGPRYMRGHRAPALVLYSLAVAIAWLVNLTMPVDSFADFWPTFFIPPIVALGLSFFYRWSD